MAFLEFLEGIANFLQGLVELNDVFSWGSSTRKNGTNGPQPNPTSGCLLRGLGCLVLFALVVLVVLYIIGTFVTPKSNPVPNNPGSAPAQSPATSEKTSPSTGTISPKDIKIPTLTR